MNKYLNTLLLIILLLPLSIFSQEKDGMIIIKEPSEIKKLKLIEKLNFSANRVDTLFYVEKKPHRYYIVKEHVYNIYIGSLSTYKYSVHSKKD